MIKKLDSMHTGKQAVQKINEIIDWINANEQCECDITDWSTPCKKCQETGQTRKADTRAAEINPRPDILDLTKEHFWELQEKIKNQTLDEVHDFIINVKVRNMFGEYSAAELVDALRNKIAEMRGSG